MGDLYYPFFKTVLAPQDKQQVLSARAVDGDDPQSYPVLVYDANGAPIGTANSKAEFIAIWNANPLNAAIGTLSGWYGTFNFMLTTKQSSALVLKGDSINSLDFVIDSDNNIVADADGAYII